MKIRNSAKLPATLNIRYNVVKTEGIVSKPLALGLVYRDNGPGARVIARLLRVSLFGGEPETIITADSDDQSPSDDFVFLTLIPACDDHVLDFDFNVYYVEVVLKKTSGDGLPALKVIRLKDHAPC